MRENVKVSKNIFDTFRGQNWTQTFFSQTFRALPGYPGKIPGYPPKKVWFPGFRGTYRTFWPPPLHVEDPQPTRKISGLKSLGLGFLSCLNFLKFFDVAPFRWPLLRSDDAGFCGGPRDFPRVVTLCLWPRGNWWNHIGPLRDRRGICQDADNEFCKWMKRRKRNIWTRRSMIDVMSLGCRTATLQKAEPASPHMCWRIGGTYRAKNCRKAWEIVSWHFFDDFCPVRKSSQKIKFQYLSWRCLTVVDAAPFRWPPCVVRWRKKLSRIFGVSILEDSNFGLVFPWGIFRAFLHHKNEEKNSGRIVCQTLVTRAKYPSPLSRDRSSNTPVALCFLWCPKLSLLHPHFFP